MNAAHAKLCDMFKEIDYMEKEMKMSEPQNAKLLIELKGVEAGSKECGECRHMYQVEDGPVFSYCTKEEFAVDSYVLLSTSPEPPLRCPACVAAEEAAKLAEPNSPIGPKKEE